MSTKITEECINCGACEPECPNTAIYAGAIEYEWQGGRHTALSADFYYIVPEKCTECVGFFDREACAAVCPVDCCVPDPALPESEGLLMDRARALHPDKEFGAEPPSRFRKAERASVVAPVPAAAAPAPVATIVAAAAPSLAPVEAPKVAPVAPPIAAPKAEPAIAAAKAEPAIAAPKVQPAVAPVAAPKVEPPVAVPKTEPPVAAPNAGAGTANFEDLRASVLGPGASSLGARLARRFRRAEARDNGGSGADGFTSSIFDSKRERERRYGEVYSVHEHSGGYHVRLELPRSVPRSGAAARLGVGDAMPDYDLDVTLAAPELTVSGHVVGAELRALCGISSAFPADFRTSIRLTGPLAAVAYRYHDKVLDIFVSKRQG